MKWLEHHWWVVVAILALWWYANSSGVESFSVPTDGDNAAASVANDAGTALDSLAPSTTLGWAGIVGAAALLLLL